MAWFIVKIIAEFVIIMLLARIMWVRNVNKEYAMAEELADNAMINEIIQEMIDKGEIKYD